MLISVVFVMVLGLSATLQAAEKGENPAAPTLKPNVAGETEKLAKEAQNPVAKLISVPFQNNFNFNTGPLRQTQYVLNLQPVIPFSITDDWNLITRTIAPFIYMPKLYNGKTQRISPRRLEALGINPGHALFRSTPPAGDEFGLGDITFTAFFSPAKSEGFLWGVGPAVVLPSATDPRLLGTGKWSLGPAAVALYSGKKVVAGALFNNVWSVAGDPDRKNVSQMTLQPFFNYNFKDGWYLCSSPLITANWNASKAQDVWVLPLGGGLGKLFHAGKLPVNTQLTAYYNVARPREAADWQLRFQLQLLFPK
ncbi:hypothetical protein [Fundidesulfovibrio terrae]|uniref:hypothetical protein n=1 Tax=Fundidesulfovibrio terrae TaxID=2922866 RepID=UPI001FAF9C32|nr:hypothetical protein [Fundidesulfovibrio terrae]